MKSESTSLVPVGEDVIVAKGDTFPFLIDNDSRQSIPVKLIEVDLFGVTLGVPRRKGCSVGGANRIGRTTRFDLGRGGTLTLTNGAGPFRHQLRAVDPIEGRATFVRLVPKSAASR